nr:phage tail terminator-like protein [Sphingobium lactosutens]
MTKRLETEWAGPSGDKTAPLLYENSAASATIPAKFIRLHVRPGTQQKRNLGNDRHRVERTGRVWVHVAIPKTTATGIAWSLSDKVSSIFANWTSPDGSLRCGEIITDVVESKDHYMIAVKITYSSSRIEF